MIGRLVSLGLGLLNHFFTGRLLKVDIMVIFSSLTLVELN
jgi:hypothetical protein